ncbi:MAG: DUF179 domain-containing protein [Rhodospirillales bacterium]|nr:DUF179 domain-containing protein [Rhodospirillales bacterium]
MPRRRFLTIVLAVLLWLPLGAAAKEATEPKGGSARNFLTGQLLIAGPQMGDPRFAESVIYMIAHDANGAFGLIVNRVLGEGPLAAFLKGFGIDVPSAQGQMRVHYGGPVEPGRGFVLHTGDYKSEHTKVVNSRISMTGERDVLKAIGEGAGPRRSIFALGYAGWGPGQLEGELARGDWLTAPADEGMLFDDQNGDKWERARKKTGLPL